jgi:CRP-like cAMP-binding protein
MLQDRFHLAAPRHNRLLACLQGAEWDRLRPSLEPTFLALGERLSEPGVPDENVYFPATAIVSLMYRSADGATAQVAMVGNEGLVGIALILGGDTTLSQAVVQSQGWAYRLSGQVLKEEFARGREFQQLLLRYAQAFLTQIAQTAVCNRHHSIEQQLCRWLLLSVDRLAGQELTSTQELVASMLGVRREGVTVAAGKLESAGLIQYRRGHITVIDRAGLEARCCECYGVVTREFDRLLAGFVHPWPNVPFIAAGPMAKVQVRIPPDVSVLAHASGPHQGTRIARTRHSHH